jgi:hypothetical protein
MFDVDFVNAFRSFHPRRTPFAWLFAIALVNVSIKRQLGLFADDGTRTVHENGDQATIQRGLTFARAFLQLRQALRVTDSGTLRRLDDEVLLSASSLSPRFRRGSDPVLSDVD